MKITFQTPKTITIVPAVIKTISGATIMEYSDNPSKKIVKVQLKEFGKLTLWEGAAYDAIGQWTDTQAQARIYELL